MVLHRLTASDNWHVCQSLGQWPGAEKAVDQGLAGMAGGRKQRGKDSAKHRLKGRRVETAALGDFALPAGCLVKASDVEELRNGASSLEQLCAVKAIVASLGVRKGVATIDASPGLEEVASMLIRVLLLPGSRALHPTIKALLLALPSDMCTRVANAFLPELLASPNHEVVLTAGTLCGIEGAMGGVAASFHQVMSASVDAMRSIVDSITFSQSSQGMPAKLDRAGEAAQRGEAQDDDDDEGITLAEPQMLVLCLHALQDVIAACPEQVVSMILEATSSTGGDGTATAERLVTFVVWLMKNEAIRKDSLTSSSIILCSLVQRTFLDPGAVAAQLACLAGCGEALDKEQVKGLYPAGRRALIGTEGVLDGAFSLDFKEMPAFAQQALFRGVLSAGNTVVLTHEAVFLAGKGGCRRSLMFSLVFDSVCQQCSDTADLFLVCYALQTLAYCIDITREALRDCLDAVGSGQDGSSMAGSAQAVTRMFDAGVMTIWPHCEDPFQGIADQMKDMFDKLIDMRELAELISKHSVAGGAPAAREGLSAAERTVIFQDLLQMAVATKPNRKVRYRVMTGLARRLGNETLLGTSPNLVAMILDTMRDQSLGSCAASLLLEMLSQDTGKDTAWWLQPCLHALTHADTKLKYAMCNYALPTLARGMPGSINSLLEALQASQPEGSGAVMSNLWAITAVIKISRRWGGETSVEPVSNTSAYRFLRAALLHVSDDMRLNALEMICINPKNAEPATEEELGLVKEFLTMNLKSSSSFYRQRCMELLKKLFVRLRVSKRNMQTKANKAKASKKAPSEAQQELLAASERYGAQVDGLVSWLAASLSASLYPGGSYERNIMALELYATVVDVWLPAVAPHPDTNLCGIGADKDEDALSMSLLFRPETVDTVINAIVNSFDHVRRSAFELISRFPAPLPGIETPEAAQGLLRWADSLVQSPRARESDAGSLIVQLVHAKYVQSLGWFLTPHAPPSVPPRSPPREGESPSLYFVNGMIGGIKRIVALALENFEATFASSFAQGALLCLRYVLSDARLPPTLKTEAGKEAEMQLWRETIEDLIALLQRVAGIAVMAMAGSPPERVGGCEGEKPLVVGGAAVSTGLFGTMYSKARGIATPHSNQRDSLAATQRNTTPSAATVSASVEHSHVSSLSTFAAGGEEEGDEEARLAALGPKEQLLVVSCWLTLKEVALVLGAVASLAPLDSEIYLSRTQLINVGNTLLDTIFSTLHNGAIEKARLGFQKLCEKLLSCKMSSLRRLPSDWLDHLLARLYDHDVPVVRRSSQLSFSILAILDAEPPNTRHILLERAVAWLFSAAAGDDDDGKRDAGSVLRAQVHALNILRHMFLDTVLSKEMATFIPQAMMRAMKGFGAQSWAVRNSSTLAFSVLLARSLGGSTQRQSFGVGEFFLRYTTLCPFFLKRLVRATEALETSREMHPELQPVLVLLAQLVPTIHVRNDMEHLQAFVPILQRCARYNNNMVRMMAARALLPFIAVHDLPRFVREDLLQKLPAPMDKSKSRAFNHHNEVHGVLEQARCLLKHTSSSESSWETTLASLLEADGGEWGRLYACLAKMIVEYLQDDRIPPPINLVLLRATSDVLWSEGSRLVSSASPKLMAPEELRRACAGACRGLLERHSEKVALARQEPMLQSLLGLASRCLSRQLMLDAHEAHTSGKGEEQWRAPLSEVLKLVTSASYEVRWMSLRGVKAGVLGRDSLEALADGPRRFLGGELMRLLPQEQDMGCLRKYLRVLLELGRGESGVALGGEGGDAWGVCAGLQKSRDARVQERGLALSGHVLARMHISEIGRMAMLGEWLDMIERFSGEANHLDQRSAAAEALSASRLLTWCMDAASVGPEETTAAVRGWLVALKLLQDDDEEVRIGIAVAVSEAVSGAKGDAGVQPSKAIELLLDHMTCKFENHPLYVKFLLSVVGAKEEGREEHVADDVMTRRLFEKECDNFQAEELLMMQCCALHVRRLGAGGSFLRAVERLRAYVDGDAARLGEKTDWAGGVSSRSDVFAEMNRLVLGVYASMPEAGQGGDEGASGRDALEAVCKSLVEQRTHLLLRSGLMQVVTTCGADSAASVLRGQDECSKLDGLSLMFLTSEQGGSMSV